VNEFFRYFINLMPQMLDGLSVTVGIFIFTLLGAIPLGVLVSYLRLAKNRLLSGAIKFYIWVFRGTPLILQVVFIYYGLPHLGIQLDSFPTAVIAFIINYTAYFAEIFRGGIQAVDRGQREAADVLGLSKVQTMLTIVLPQAFKSVLPALGNEAITLIKDSALVYVISLSDLLRVVTVASIRDFTVTPFFVAAVLYLVMTFLLERLIAFVEARYSYYE
jgi:polar amino acid transport system permease protein